MQFLENIVLKYHQFLGVGFYPSHVIVNPHDLETYLWTQKIYYSNGVPAHPGLKLYGLEVFVDAQISSGKVVVGV